MFIGPSITASGSPYLSAVNTGLGNVLFQIASVYGLSKRYGRTPTFGRVLAFGAKLHRRFGFHHSETIFRNCQQYAQPDDSFESVNERAHKRECQAVLAAIEATRAPLRINGYLEAPSYFLPYASEIRQLFAPDKESLERIRAAYPELFDTSTISVSIHVRQGADRNTGCSVQYYQRAVEYIRHRVPNARFFVVSDGDVPDMGIPVTRVRGHEDYIDLWVCSLCTHNITTYSTFSWWGAFLNDHPSKLVTYPKSAANFISRTNGLSLDTIQREYFLGAVCIEDTE
jgi:hypothetical protein